MASRQGLSSARIEGDGRTSMSCCPPISQPARQTDGMISYLALSSLKLVPSPISQRLDKATLSWSRGCAVQPRQISWLLTRFTHSFPCQSTGWSLNNSKRDRAPRLVFMDYRYPGLIKASIFTDLKLAALNCFNKTVAVFDGYRGLYHCREFTIPPLWQLH